MTDREYWKAVYQLRKASDPDFLQKNRDACKAWQKANPEKHNARMREYYQRKKARL